MTHCIFDTGFPRCPSLGPATPREKAATPSREQNRLVFAAALVLSLTAVAPALAATINIVAIGASTTAGKRVGLDEAYPAPASGRLRRGCCRKSWPRSARAGSDCRIS